MLNYTEELAEDIASKLAKISEIEVKEKSKSYKMIITKEVKDRDGEIIIIEGIDLRAYKKNPVVLLDHSYKVEDIVWKTTKLYVEWNKLIADFIFASTVKGQLAEELYNNGLLKTSSIWFISKSRDPENMRIITESELLEWSLVAVPANASALSLDGKQALYKKGVDAGLIKQETPEENSEKEPEKKEFEISGKIVKIENELKDIKNLLKILTDDKVKEDVLDEEVKELKAKHGAIVEIKQSLDIALKNLKIIDK